MPEKLLGSIQLCEVKRTMIWKMSDSLIAGERPCSHYRVFLDTSFFKGWVAAP